jgi:protein disulfide-isomerase A1
MYFSSASGKLLQYEGDRTAEGIIDFIRKNKDSPDTADSASSEPAKDEL